MKPILSLRDLSARLCVRVTEMRVIAGDIKSHYKQFPLVKGNKVRQLTVPSKQLKNLQRRIKNNILDQIPLPQNVHGGVLDRSPRTNAAVHLNQPCLVNLDVRDFFPQVRHGMVYRMFVQELGFGRDVSSLLTKLTTLNDGLPQGAPTSTAIGNLFLARRVDEPLLASAAKVGIRCSRFVDDIALSGLDPRPLINTVARLLSAKRLRLYRHKAKWESKPKLRVMSSRGRQEVTGLVVNPRKGPSVSRSRRDQTRAAIFGLERSSKLNSLEVNSIRGKIAYINEFNPGAAKRLRRQLADAMASRA
jgi:RNA-directed DNA polymerase